jgi:effector-binding domain-containing protein
VKALPTDSTGSMPLSLTTWSYGDVAEVLHIGPYNTEQRDIERLKAFVASQGCTVVGDHEEEYVKGPGMIFAGNPDRYLTIIRLRVLATAAP